MTLFKWHIVKAGQVFFVRKRSLWYLYLGYEYADPDPRYFWTETRHVLEYCRFSTYESAFDRAETLNIIG